MFKRQIYELNCFFFPIMCKVFDCLDESPVVKLLIFANLVYEANS